jgi:hypothetical protein
MLEIFWINEWLVASQKELCFTELVMGKETVIAIPKIANYYAKPLQVYIYYFKIVKYNTKYGSKFLSL